MIKAEEIFDNNETLDIIKIIYTASIIDKEFIEISIYFIIKEILSIKKIDKLKLIEEFCNWIRETFDELASNNKSDIYLIKTIKKIYDNIINKLSKLINQYGTQTQGQFKKTWSNTFKLLIPSDEK